MGFHSFLVPLQDVQGDPIQSPGNPSQALFSPGALQPGTPRPPQFPQLCCQPRGSLSLSPRFILQIDLTFPFDSVSPEISEPEGQGETLLKDRGGQGPGKDAGMGLQWQV